MEDIDRVQKLLRADETCTFAAPMKELKSNRKLSILVAVVFSAKSKDEISVFVLGTRFESVYIREVIPVYADMIYKVSNDNPLVFELRYEAVGEGYSFEAVSPNSVKMLLPLLQKGYTTAKENGWTKAANQSHQWASYYHAFTEEAVASARQMDATSAKLQQGKNVDGNMAWLMKMMKTRESEFTTTQNILVSFGTWNVNGQKPSESLDEWLIPKGDVKPDIYCLGFQELDLTAEALLLGDTSRAAPWDAHIQDTLRRVGEYRLLLMRQLVGVLLCVYVRADLMPRISGLQSNLAAVGIMGMMGNKGGIGVRFNIGDTTFCIVNSHLNAHLDNIARRNQDYRDISRRIVFGGGGAPGASPSVADDDTGCLSIFDHDYLFWMGDLNYRLAAPADDIFEKIKKEDYSALMPWDQLMQQMKSGQAFEVFQEAPLRFAPTYKYDKNSQVYDTSEKAREPAYCDRVLFRTQDPISVLSYSRHELLSSDHRPVSAIFNIKMKTVISDTKARVYHELLKQLDIMENECMPDAAISSNQVAAGEVFYQTPVVRTLTLSNKGQVMAKWRFIPKLEEKRVCKNWLQIIPVGGVMLPMETCTIRFTFLVDNTTAPLLNCGKDKMEDILILHLEQGKDTFIAVSGQYQRSSFGSLSVDYLSLWPQPVRSSQPLTEKSDEKLYVPKELWRMVDFIYRRGMEEPHIFMQSGSTTEIESIRECLDTGAMFGDFSVHSMAEALVLFLDSLQEPVVPYDLYFQCLEFSGSYALCKQIVTSYLSAVNYNVFYYLMSFLRELITYANKNGVVCDKLAVVFGNVILRPPPGASSSSSARPQAHAPPSAAAPTPTPTATPVAPATVAIPGAAAGAQSGSVVYVDEASKKRSMFLLHFLLDECAGASPSVVR
eukprot:TRINITY_DN7160_c0_g1_i1.p1 TRINITY_DN7160_c0_g1~~TRINITY_DN7160_c0_g1_i1.p1  ORF type:complete len:899 (-),score=261.26 TRINITY_DN7160_c0_g1_i1:102-2771(-)